MDSLELSVRCLPEKDSESGKFNTKSNSEEPYFECNEEDLHA